MTSKSHEFFVTARDRKHIFRLLSAEGIAYIGRGKGGRGLIGKLAYMLRTDRYLYRLAKEFRPDFFIHFGAVYASHASRFTSAVDIIFDDTDHARLNHLSYVPFTDLICTPASFRRDFGKKHLRFTGFMELCYLHPAYFIPDPDVLDLLGISKNEQFVIIRFISWNALHDRGQAGITLGEKRRVVRELSKFARVFISTEGELPSDLKEYEIKIPPEKMHDALAFAALFFGEGGTMATECSLLGTPNVLVNPLSKNCGVHSELQGKYGLKFFYDSYEAAIEKAVNLLKQPDLKGEWQERRRNMLDEKIDVTAFMMWLVENYPDSVKIMRQCPDYQNNFK
jgi:hypothetical protein